MPTCLTVFHFGVAMRFFMFLSEPPPRVVHLRIGNMQLRDLFSFLQRIWPRVEELSSSSRLVIVRPTLIECIS